MRDGPRRLLEGGDEMNDLLSRALDAERSDDVDARRLERIGRGLAAATAAPLPTASMHAAAPHSPTTAAKTSWLAGKGPVGLLAVAGIAAVAALGLRAQPSPVAPAPPVETSPPVIEPTPAPEPPTMSPSDLPSAPVAAQPAPPRSTAKPLASASAEGDEIGLLARAHESLRSNPTRSLALCKEHESRFASGQFAQEREAVAIEALVYLGRRDEANRRWTSFRERYPSSSHRVHLESLLAAPAAQ